MEEEQGTRMSDKTSGKDRSRKSEEIASILARGLKGTGAVTPGDQPINEREQQSSKKKREEQKRTMDQYFGGGGRVLPPSKGGTPVQSILLRRLAKTPEHAKETDNTVKTQLTGTNANMAVDLEGFTPGVRPKGNGSKKRDKGKQGEDDRRAG